MSGLHDMPDALKQLIEQWIRDKKVGNIQINFYLGGISTIKVEETLKINKTK